MTTFADAVIASSIVYFSFRPFFKARYLTINIEDDLKDWCRLVRGQLSHLDRCYRLLDRAGLLTNERTVEIGDACAAIKTMTTWEDVARADRLATEALDGTLFFLRTVALGDLKDSVLSLVLDINTADGKLIRIRNDINRDLPKLNRSFVHRIPWLARAIEVKLYPIAATVKWYGYRDVRYPRWERFGCIVSPRYRPPSRKAYGRGTNDPDVLNTLAALG